MREVLPADVLDKPAVVRRGQVRRDGVLHVETFAKNDRGQRYFRETTVAGVGVMLSIAPSVCE